MLTKLQWEVKIYQDYRDIYKMELPILDNLSWWIKGKGMHLTADGFFRFNQVKIEFYKFEIDYNTIWSGSIVLGLAKMPCPYYCDHNKNQKSSLLYIVEQQYAVLLKMLDLDLNTFTKEFIKNEIV